MAMAGGEVQHPSQIVHFSTGYEERQKPQLIRQEAAGVFFSFDDSPLEVTK